jgi:Cupin superfamily protein
MVESNTPSGGSRASKKRRKSTAVPLEEPASTQKGNKSKSETSDVTPTTKKSPKYSADTLSRASLELDNAASAATPSSSSAVKSKSQDELLKLSIKEVLNLEEIVDVDCPTRAAAVLSIILSPFDRSTFYSDYWEKRPLHCGSAADKKRSIRGLLSTKQFRNILKSQSLLYGLDVTTSKIKADYSSMLPGAPLSEIDQEELVEAKETELLQHFEEGFSIRLTCPQKFHDPLWSLLSVLEFEFGSRVGCRVELLPPNGAGFKPKYDNFDSIIVQLDGQSRWRLYSFLEGHELPRCPSYEIEVSDLPGVVSLETILNPGDSLYIPKGWTHREDNATAETSMFLTIQVNESNSVADLFESVMPEALAEAIEKSTDMRRSLPRAFHSFMGVASSENDSDPLRLVMQNFFLFLSFEFYVFLNIFPLTLRCYCVYYVHTHGNTYTYSYAYWYIY